MGPCFSTRGFLQPRNDNRPRIRQGYSSNGSIHVSFDRKIQSLAVMRQRKCCWIKKQWHSSSVGQQKKLKKILCLATVFSAEQLLQTRDSFTVVQREMQMSLRCKDPGRVLYIFLYENLVESGNLCFSGASSICENGIDKSVSLCAVSAAHYTLFSKGKHRKPYMDVSLKFIKKLKVVCFISTHRFLGM